MKGGENVIVFFLLYMVLCLYGVKIHKNLNRDYLSMDNTQSIKGIFIVLVFFSHFNSYVSYSGSFDILYYRIISMFGQTMVTLFLFYSGYGIMESINKKGISYVKQIPGNRVLKTLFRFACAVFIFFLIGTFAIGQKYTLRKVLFSLVGWDSIGNSNWYIFVIMVLYLITYMSFRFLMQKNRIIPIIISCVTIMVLIALDVVYRVKTYTWVDSALCYIAGMAYSQYRKKLEAIINKNNLIYCAITFIALLALAFLKYRFDARNIVSRVTLNLCFAGVMVLLTMRVTLKNKILMWCGKNLFEIYILQRIPMMVFQNIGLADFNIYLYFVVCVAFTVAMVWPFKFVTERLWRMLGKMPLLFKRKKSELI